MNETPVLDSLDICGFYELNADGMVRYARAQKDCRLWKPAESMIGHDFFAEISKFSDVEALRRRFSAFVSGHISTDNLRFTFEASGKKMPLRVLLVRIMENTDGGREPVYCLDIKHNDHAY